MHLLTSNNPRSTKRKNSWFLLVGESLSCKQNWASIINLLLELSNQKGSGTCYCVVCFPSGGGLSKHYQVRRAISFLPWLNWEMQFDALLGLQSSCMDLLFTEQDQVTNLTIQFFSKACVRWGQNFLGCVLQCSRRFGWWGTFQGQQPLYKAEEQGSAEPTYHQCARYKFTLGNFDASFIESSKFWISQQPTMTFTSFGQLLCQVKLCNPTWSGMRTIHSPPSWSNHSTRCKPLTVQKTLLISKFRRAMQASAQHLGYWKVDGGFLGTWMLSSNLQHRQWWHVVCCTISVKYQGRRSQWLKWISTPTTISVSWAQTLTKKLRLLAMTFVMLCFLTGFITIKTLSNVLVTSSSQGKGAFTSQLCSQVFNRVSHCAGHKYIAGFGFQRFLQQMQQVLCACAI